MCPNPAQQPSSPSYPILASHNPRPVRGPLIRSVSERRLQEFVGSQYADYNLTSLLFEHRTDDANHIQIESWTPNPGTKPSFDQAKQQKYVKAQKGMSFGPSWTNHWLRLTINVPEDWRSKEWVQIEFDPNCEAMFFSKDGMPLQGITGGSEKRRVDFPLKPSQRSNTIFYVEVTANGMFGLPADGSGDPDPNRYFTLVSCDIVVKRPEAWKLMWDFDMLQGCVTQLPKDGILQNKALWVANQIQNTFRNNDIGSLTKCRQLANEILGDHWEQDKEKVYEKDIVQGRQDTRIWALGHSHIDSAWLWPFSATQQKVARSWSTQLDLMDRYPEYRFTASTAQQFQWLETLYPNLFKRVQDKVKEGIFQPVGGSWVECDANMPSGEAFVRQFLYGQRYFKSRFGERCGIFWLPDTFGYNAQIPQLARQAGCDYFFTQKLSWSNINRFPHNTVMWVGLDGTQIIVHMTPVDNYDAQGGADELVRGIKNNQDLAVQPNALFLFGWGDGGGGPSQDILERLRRARAMSNNGYKEIPKVTAGHSAKDFFEHVRETTDNGKMLATWSGEIYLEYHRGVYTSHGSIKQWNRRIEVLMQKLEWINTLASLRADSFEYPKKELDDIWEPFLLNQFHDCLPGSSIRMVYDDMETIYSDLFKRGTQLWQKALHALGVETDIQKPQSLSYFAVNTLDFPRRELVSLSLDKLPRAEAIALSHKSVQLCDGGKNALLLVQDAVRGSLATMAEDHNRLMRNLEAVTAEEMAHNQFTLKSSTISLVVSKGRITSIYDRVAGRELIEEGRTAGLVIAEDYPPQFDNWETEIYSLDTLEEIAFDSVRIAENGPWRASLALEATFGKSRVKLQISLDAIPAAPFVSPNDIASRPVIRFDTEIDWWEKHRFLRFHVPTCLRSDVASYETQFGITKRPTSRNTSWEAAKFEVCGHRFSDLSESEYGLSILTESKYGYSVEGGDMRLSLLKAGTYPDAHEDEGLHHFAFGLYPHVGDLVKAKVVQVARAFNARFDLTQTPPDAMTDIERFTMPIQLIQESENQGVVLDTIKRAEQDFEYYGQQPEKEGSVAVIARLYESIGSSCKVSLKISVPIQSVALTNLLEDDDTKASKQLQLETYTSEQDDTFVLLSFRPFEIKTVKIYVK